MSAKIEPNAPAAPQNRKQIMTPDGNYVPVPDVPQGKSEPTADAAAFKIGDKVTLVGRVLEIQHPQGGQTSIKVQMPNGAAWIQGAHLEPAPAVDFETLQKAHAVLTAVHAEAVEALKAKRVEAEDSAARVEALEATLKAKDAAAQNK